VDLSRYASEFRSNPGWLLRLHLFALTLAKFQSALRSVERLGVPNISLTYSVNIAMKTSIITTVGIAFCSLIATIGAIGQTVSVPAGQTTVITEAPAPPTVDTFLRALDSNRYQLIEKKDNKEVYRDIQTGEKWILELHHRNG
jgi:hypothetical protein